jgi:ComF family protein
MTGSGYSLVADAATRLGRLARGFVDAALPQTCAACGEWTPGSTGPVCAACDDEVSAVMASPYCPRCGRTLPRPAIHADCCARCKDERFWNVAGVARVGLYAPVLRALLVGLKYRGRERNAGYLTEWLSAALRAQGWSASIDALVPVPMHWLRRMQRPCDHAQVLAERLGQRMHVPVMRLVRRVRHAPSQTGLVSKTARFENVKGCFAPPAWYAPPWPKPDFARKTVCIVDNLLSTGATITEVSKVVRRAGAKRIYAAVVARPAAPGDPRFAQLPDEETPG